MRIVIIGAGLLGVSSAYFLARAGHQVTVLERREAAGMETSFANSGMVTPSQADPWNSPGTLRRLLAWLSSESSPFILNPSVLPSLLGWGIVFLRNSSITRFRDSLEKNVELANYSLKTFEVIRRETDIRYDQLMKGTLKVYREDAAFARAAAISDVLNTVGVNHEILDGDGVIAQEPALADIAGEISGGVYYPDDESGDAHKFCRELTVLAEHSGAEFRFSTEVTDIRHAGGRIGAVVTPGQVYTGDAYVMAAGSYSVPLGRMLGLKLPIRPIKGYSITLNRNGWDGGPSTPIIDDSRHVAITPLGDRIRVAGMAEFAGYNTAIDNTRIARLDRVLDDIYPAFTGYKNSATAQYWAGLRPYCCDGVPIIGRASHSNLYLNTGHGHLGWSMSVGSGRLLADIISGRDTDIDASPYSYERFE
jgi:D-amino-acid dehydrogenase